MLATASRAVGGRGGSSPVLLGLLLTCDANSLTVTGTDLDLTIQVTGEVIGIGDGSRVIPARLSTDIVRRLEPGAVTFADQGDHITISAAVRPSNSTRIRWWSSHRWARRTSQRRNCRRRRWAKPFVRSYAPHRTTTAGHC